MPTLVEQQIVNVPGVCGGRACIAGHRVRVADIVVWHERRGYSPDEIVGLFPGLTLGDVHGALAYYFDNRAEIEADLRDEENWAARLDAARSSNRPETAAKWRKVVA